MEITFYMETKFNIPATANYVSWHRKSCVSPPCAMGAHHNELILISIYNICFCWVFRKLNYCLAEKYIQSYVASVFTMPLVTILIDYKRGMDTLSGETTLSNWIAPLFKNVSTLKGKNVLPRGAHSFLLE